MPVLIPSKLSEAGQRAAYISKVEASLERQPYGVKYAVLDALTKREGNLAETLSELVKTGRAHLDRCRLTGEEGLYFPGAGRARSKRRGREARPNAER